MVISNNSAILYIDLLWISPLMSMRSPTLGFCWGPEFHRSIITSGKVVLLTWPNCGLDVGFVCVCVCV